MSRAAASIVDWAWAGRALDDESGDLHVVLPFAGGVLIALIDGLGHGADAALAAREAAALLALQPNDEVSELLRRCHAGLRKTRGVAMTIASVQADEAAVAWAGIGNVDAVIVRASPWQTRASVALRGGVVGYNYPAARVDTVRIEVGDTLVMATDGIRSHFFEGVSAASSPQEIASQILTTYGKGTDDAHVLVARYSGIPA